MIGGGEFEAMDPRTGQIRETPQPAHRSVPLISTSEI